ncbi:hypothetical protein BH11CYA1_BH11CYA1_28360 [soil metagenome]
MQNAGETPQTLAAQDLIDMTPNLSARTYDRLLAALDSGAAIADGAAQYIPPHERLFSKKEREALTNSSVAKIVEQLTFTSDRLGGAMHRIGYLESQVDTMEAQLSFLPEFRAKAARAIVLELENFDYKEIVEQRNMQLLKRERMLEEKDQQIAILEKVLAAHRKHLNMVENDLEKLETNPFVRFWAWFSGMPLPKR